MTDSPFGPGGRAPSHPVLRTVLGAIFLVGLGAAAWWLTRTPPPAADPMAGHDHAAPVSDSTSPVVLTAEAANRIGITFAAATAGPLAREVRVVAQVAPDESRISLVTLKVDGWVERLHVNQTGQSVQAGQPLLSLYSPMVVAAQEEWLVARRLRDGMSGADSGSRTSAEALLASARRRLEYWGIPASAFASMEASGVASRLVEFTSPASGAVIDKLVVEGQRVMAGEPILRLADLDRVWLEGEVFEQDLGLVRLGAVAEVELAALPGETVTGAVSFIAPLLDPATRTARIRVTLANPRLRLKPGMFGTLRLAAQPTSGVLIPRAAVLVTGERAIVFVRGPDGTLTPREVRLGPASADQVVIMSGLAAGEVVVASATFLLDAESNLGAALKAMANMPGMDMPPPAARPAPAPPPAMDGMPGMEGMPGMGRDSTGARKTGGADAHTNH